VIRAIIDFLEDGRYIEVTFDDDGSAWSMIAAARGGFPRMFTARETPWNAESRFEQSWTAGCCHGKRRRL
jgi:hypothetical protein